MQTYRLFYYPSFLIILAFALFVGCKDSPHVADQAVAQPSASAEHITSDGEQEPEGVEDTLPPDELPSIGLKIGDKLWSHPDWKFTNNKPMLSANGRYITFRLLKTHSGNWPDVYMGVYDFQKKDMVLFLRERTALGFYDNDSKLLVSSQTSLQRSPRMWQIIDMETGIDSKIEESFSVSSSFNHFHPIIRAPDGTSLIIKNKSELFGNYDSGDFSKPICRINVSGKKESTLDFSVDGNELYWMTTNPLRGELENKEPFTCFIALDKSGTKRLREFKGTPSLFQRLPQKDEAILVDATARFIQLDLTTGSIIRKTDPREELQDWLESDTRFWEYIPGRNLLALHTTWKVWFIEVPSFEVKVAYTNRDFVAKLGKRYRFEFIKALNNGSLIFNIGGEAYFVDIVDIGAGS